MLNMQVFKQYGIKSKNMFWKEKPYFFVGCKCYTVIETIPDLVFDSLYFISNTHTSSHRKPSTRFRQSVSATLKSHTQIDKHFKITHTN